jgi:MFS family permease
MLFQTRYGQSVETSGLNYISAVIGFTLGSQIGANLTDRVYQHIKNRPRNLETGTLPRPEHRLILVAPAIVLIPAGVLLFGWGAEYRLHWIVPNIGLALFSAGSSLCVQCTFNYTIDSAGEYASSAMAGIAMARSLTGFTFPLFGPALFASVGWGWGNSILAGGTVLIGVVCPTLLWKYGVVMRDRGRLSEMFLK